MNFPRIGLSFERISFTNFKIIGATFMCNGEELFKFDVKDNIVSVPFDEPIYLYGAVFAVFQINPKHLRLLRKFSILLILTIFVQKEKKECKPGVLIKSVNGTMEKYKN